MTPHAPRLSYGVPDCCICGCMPLADGGRVLSADGRALASRRALWLYESMAHRQSWRGYAVVGHRGAGDHDILIDSQTLYPTPLRPAASPQHVLDAAQRCHVLVG